MFGTTPHKVGKADGEAAVESLVELADADKAAVFGQLGMGESVAEKLHRGSTTTWAAILGLYRSAAQPVVGQLGDDLPEAAQRPGLCIFATEDSYTGGETLHRYAAERCEAEIAVLEGLGHWWMCEDPTQAAELLNNWFDSQD